MPKQREVGPNIRQFEVKDDGPQREFFRSPLNDL
jgi:hypothetical protein